MGTILKSTGVVALALGLGAAVAGGCGTDPGADSEVRISASTTHPADLATQVAGERATVSGILEPGSDPHDYEPRPSDAEALLDADLILRSGGEVDLWLDDLIEGAGAEAPVIDMLEAVEAPSAEDEPDPHWWQDPIRAAAAVEAVRDELVAVDPDGAGEYETNAADYLRELRQLDRTITRCVGSAPAEQRKLVTSHDSLGRYAERYDIEVVGAAIPALSTQAQPSAGETADVVELIREQGVSAVFPEAGVSAELERAIADDAGAAVGSELWADTLGPAGSGAETYLGAMAANTVTLADGFSGGAVSCELDTGEGG